ncbi:MAG TPA: V-type ATP synthase subunit I [Methanophagales archaeon]|nr:V-type ATP synthase subunit I [Methanophagales archaeon]
MLRPVEMRELRIVTLDEDVDRVIKRIEALGNVHLTDIKEFLDAWEGLIEPSKADTKLLKSSELLARIDNLISILQPEEVEKKSLKEMLFKAPEEEQIERIKVERTNLAEMEGELKSLEETVNKLRDGNERSKEELSNTENILRVLALLDDFDIDLDFIGEKEFVIVHAGILPNVNLEVLRDNLEEVTGGNNFIASKELTSEESFAVIVTLKKDKGAVERALKAADFEIWQRPPLGDIPERTKEAIATLNAKVAELESSIKDNERDLAVIREDRFNDLLVMQELVQIEENRERVKVLLGESARTRVIEGWTPKEEVDRVIDGINDETSGFCVIDVKEPKREDVRVPSLLKNPKIVKPFESVVGMYGHPLYNDIDPTLITAIMFPILFGLMFPDIGHGMFLLAIGLALMFAFRGLGKEIRGVGVILVLCGICSLIIGFLFGEFFGLSEYAHHLVHDSMGMSIPEMFVFEPLWFEPIPNVTVMFVLTMLIGTLHMGLGLLFSAINKVSSRDKFGVIWEAVKIWCLFGTLYFLLLLLSSSLKGIDIGIAVFVATVISHIEPMAGIIILVALPVLILFAFKVVSELRHEKHGKAEKGEKLSGMDYIILLIDGVIDAVLENLFRFLANIVSYGRILALALCHAALMEVFILLAFMCWGSITIVGPVIGVIIFIAGNAIVIVLEAIMAGIHTIRLHFYEWFTKFYDGGGVEFSPFRFSRTYTARE